VETAQLAVRLIGHTSFVPPDDVAWVTDVDGGQALIEFAGRACYQSWSKPNPATATNAGYLQHLLEVGHLSVLEHATATFYVTGVSRSLTHELVRHRHLSYSQLSQRYVPERTAPSVPPPVIQDDPELLALFTSAYHSSQAAYGQLLEALEKRFAGVEQPTARRKQARQAARAVLPNATETRIVVSGNFRAWRDVIVTRATEAADVEIRAFAIAVLRELTAHAPHAFADFTITDLPDGTHVAATEHAASPR
jgi:thymidylate synthase (FAD)